MSNSSSTPSMSSTPSKPSTPSTPSTPQQRAQWAEALITVRDYIRWTVTQFNALPDQEALFFGHGTDNAWDEAVALVLAALRLPWHILEQDPNIGEARLTAEERHKIIEWVEQRTVDRRPLPYISGEAWFAGLPFYVDERVLIPRSPIAELLASRLAPWWKGEDEPLRLLDLCTGSGAIAVAAAKAFPQSPVDAIDLSSDALAVAQRNIERHAVEGQVQLIESDLFSALDQAEMPLLYDIILSNPPYVGDAEMAMLPSEFLREPDLALRAEENGLAIVRNILANARRFLTDEGVLIVEVGNTCQIMEEAFPDLPLHWLEFERGGFGVFLIRAVDLPLTTP